MEDSLLIFFFFITGFTCLAYGIFLFSWKHHRSNSNYVLALIMLDMGLIQVNSAFYHTFKDVYIEIFQTLKTRELLLLKYYLLGPLFFLYAKFDVKRSISLVEYLFASIPVIYIAFWILFFLKDLDNLPLLQNWNDLPSSIFNISYPSLALVFILKKRQNLKKSRFYWHQFIHVLFIIMIFCILVSDVLEHVGFEDYQHLMPLYVCYILLVIFVYGQIYILIRYPDVLTNSKYLRDRINAHPEDRYKESPMSEAYERKILNDLDIFLWNKENFSNSDLTLDSISASLGYPSRDISQAVNSTLRKSFKEYLNEMRIKNAVSLIKENPDILIKEVMYASGFNSRSLFTRYMKEKTGLTPQELKRQSPDFKL